MGSFVLFFQNKKFFGKRQEDDLVESKYEALGVDRSDGQEARDFMKKIRELLKECFPEILLGTLVVWAYFPTFVWMWDRWVAKDSYYSHGMLVPFVSAYLIWQKRPELARMTLCPDRRGVRLIVFGVFVHVVSSLFRVYFSSAFSLLLVLPGIIMLLYGQKILREVIFPIFFLFFMFPLPIVVVVNISFQMKIFAAEIAQKCLQNMGFAAMRDGSILRMPHAHVVVEDVCSGLRSLISLAALGSIFAYWLKASLWRRVFLFFLTVPIAVITNVFRIVFLSAISEIWGPQAATGFIHDLSGFSVFALAFVLLYSVMRVIE